MKSNMNYMLLVTLELNSLTFTINKGMIVIRATSEVGLSKLTKTGEAAILAVITRKWKII
jgi:hypothetical protein